MKKIVFIIAIIFFTLSFVIISIYTVNGIGRMAGRLETKTAAIFDEIAIVRERYDSLKMTFGSLVDDSNQIRRALALPETEYSLDEEDPESRPITLNEAMFDGLTMVIDQSEKTRAAEKLGTLLEDPIFKSKIAGLGMTIARPSGTVAELVAKGYLCFSLSTRNGSVLSVSPAGGMTADMPIDADTVTSYLVQSITSVNSYYYELAKIYSELKDLLSSPDIKNTITAKGFVLREPQDEPLVLLLVNDERDLSFPISIDGPGRLGFGAESFETPEAITAAVDAYLKKADTRASGQAAVDAALETLNAFLNDEGIKSFLKEKGLSLGTPSVRNDRAEDYYYADLFDSDRKPAGAIGVNRVSGMIFFFGANYIPIASLDRIMEPQFDEKKN